MDTVQGQISRQSFQVNWGAIALFSIELTGSGHLLTIILQSVISVSSETFSKKYHSAVDKQRTEFTSLTTKSTILMDMTFSACSYFIWG